MVASSWPASIAEVLASEGGWSDHPRDPGGATMMGITLAVFRVWRGNHQLGRRELRKITEEEVKAIYRDLYWNAVQADYLIAGIDHVVFDMAVNAGVRRSSLQLQMAIEMSGADLDGVIGPRTLAAHRAQDTLHVIGRLGELHEAHYRGLRTFDVFGAGWMARLGRRLRLAHELLQPGSMTA
jgi:lysozyme family protein